MSDPILEYRSQIEAGNINHDPQQLFVIEQLQILHNRLISYNPSSGFNLKRIFGFADREPVPKGIYIYGDVGRGKSMLMDLFYKNAPLNKKSRIHFHEFMQNTHDAIYIQRQDSKDESHKDPVEQVANSIAESNLLLCFDEFQVNDITDAMLLGRLFASLFANGVIFVITSNRHPDDLYKDGLNRQLFLPFIDTLKDKLNIIALDSPNDYRQHLFEDYDCYYSPNDSSSKEKLTDIWRFLTNGAKPASRVFRIKGRELIIDKTANNIAWCSFEELCKMSLGAADYLLLAKNFNTLILEDVPAMGPDNRNEAKRFVNLIDALYESKTGLIISAEVAPDKLYMQGKGRFEFKRTVSRIMEMQSSAYKNK